MSEALIGFIGVIIGAFAAFGGTVYVQRVEAKRRREEERRASLIALQDAIRDFERRGF
jgi:hypothetical protein